jgi:hypothetical protein
MEFLGLHYVIATYQLQGRNYTFLNNVAGYDWDLTAFNLI